MCLTVCRVTETVYDNDRTLVCSTCPFRERRDKSQTCSNCKNLRVDENGQEYCLLTSMSLPKTRWCCHWNAPASLSYYPHNLKQADGIVLVAPDEIQEVIHDYQPCLSPQEDELSLEEFFDEDDIFSAFDAEEDENNPIAIINNNDLSDLEEIALEELAKKADYRRLTQEEAQNGVYVPIAVGEPLVKYHQGVKGVIRWFEAIFGGREDIMLDWKGRWIVKPHRFAVPAVYGVASEKWSELIEEDVTGLIHDLFN